MQRPFVDAALIMQALFLPLTLTKAQSLQMLINIFFIILFTGEAQEFCPYLALLIDVTDKSLTICTHKINL